MAYQSRSQNEDIPQKQKIRRGFVLLDFQFNKCGYCERLLGVGDMSSIEFDLEHFRPKSVSLQFPLQIQLFSLGRKSEKTSSGNFTALSTFVAFEDRNHRTPSRRRDARLALAEIESNAFEHRNCARAFLKICEENHDLAEAYYSAALDYIESILNRG